MLAPTASVLRALREAYAVAISNTMYFSLAVAAMALVVAGGVEWLNVKVVARERKEGLVGGEG